jgi:DNA invertase Pin-like site-specific DNA recombinase
MRLFGARCSSSRNAPCGDKHTGLEDIELDVVFKDTIVRKKQFLSQFEFMMSYVREGDTLFVEKMDRLGRNPDEFLRHVRQLTRRGVRIECLSERLTFPAGEESPLRNLLLLTIKRKKKKRQAC